MKDLLSEYGKFVIAIAAASIIFYVITFLPTQCRLFTEKYISIITGVEDTEYQ